MDTLISGWRVEYYKQLTCKPHLPHRLCESRATVWLWGQQPGPGASPLNCPSYSVSLPQSSCHTPQSPQSWLSPLHWFSITSLLLPQSSCLSSLSPPPPYSSPNQSSLVSVTSVSILFRSKTVFPQLLLITSAINCFICPVPAKQSLVVPCLQLSLNLPCLCLVPLTECQPVLWPASTVWSCACDLSVHQLFGAVPLTCLCLNCLELCLWPVCALTVWSFACDLPVP